jgi:hypothetical protein
MSAFETRRPAPNSSPAPATLKITWENPENPSETKIVCAIARARGSFLYRAKSVTAMNERNQLLPREQREANAGWRIAFNAGIAPQMQEVPHDPQRFH